MTLTAGNTYDCYHVELLCHTVLPLSLFLYEQLSLGLPAAAAVTAALDGLPSATCSLVLSWEACVG